jgi:hypothetical protein
MLIDLRILERKRILNKVLSLFYSSNIEAEMGGLLIQNNKVSYRQKQKAKLSLLISDLGFFPYEIR